MAGAGRLPAPRARQLGLEGGLRRAASTWRRSSGTTRHGDEFQPEVNYYVGGNTKFYGAALFRLRPEDFGEISHHGGVSPAWPIGYDDLEPYYTQAEHLYQVHGRHGEDPTEGTASAEYAYPPVSHEPRIQQLSDDLEKLGLHPFHLPIGVDLTEDETGRADPHERLHPVQPRRRLPLSPRTRRATRRSSASIRRSSSTT